MALSGAMPFIIQFGSNILLRIFTSFLGALTVSLYANANSQEIVIIENVNVIPMTSEVVLKNQSVVVKNGKVERIGNINGLSRVDILAYCVDWTC